MAARDRLSARALACRTCRGFCLAFFSALFTLEFEASSKNRMESNIAAKMGLVRRLRRKGRRGIQKLQLAAEELS